jgi:hypothetical protein
MSSPISAACESSRRSGGGKPSARTYERALRAQNGVTL